VDLSYRENEGTSSGKGNVFFLPSSSSASAYAATALQRKRSRCAREFRAAVSFFPLSFFFFPSPLFPHPHVLMRSGSVVRGAEARRSPIAETVFSPLFFLLPSLLSFPLFSYAPYLTGSRKKTGTRAASGSLFLFFPPSLFSSFPLSVWWPPNPVSEELGGGGVQLNVAEITSFFFFPSPPSFPLLRLPLGNMIGS